MSNIISTVFFWLLVFFGYFWAMIVYAAGQPFDAMVILLLSATLHLNSDKIVEKLF